MGLIERVLVVVEKWAGVGRRPHCGCSIIDGNRDGDDDNGVGVRRVRSDEDEVRSRECIVGFYGVLSMVGVGGWLGVTVFLFPPELTPGERRANPCLGALGLCD